MAELALMTKEDLEKALQAQKDAGIIKDFRHCETLQGFLIEPVIHTRLSPAMEAAAGYWRKEDVWGLK